MIHPFHEGEDRLKPASYEVAIQGTYVYWDEHGERQQDEIERDHPFFLKANSIAFVTLEPFFQLPEYIAIRFNLRITNIYRGLLLGTGPLVDPGFIGKLSMPLHNLTTNDYELVGGEGLIWMEITKVSPRPDAERLEGPEPARTGRIFPLPSAKKEKTVVDYLHKAAPGQAIRSSIPKAVEEATGRARNAEEAARKAQEEARRSEAATEKTQHFIEGALLLAIIVGFISAAGVVASMYSLVNGVNARIDALGAAIPRSQSGALNPRRSLPCHARMAYLGSQAAVLRVGD
jgi:deoxycytidine triphosphate deaminase